MSFDEQAWNGVTVAFETLGRAVLLLDQDLCVLRTTHTVDSMVCDTASAHIVGHRASDLLGTELFRDDGPVREALAVGHRREGHRAFFQCGKHGARLVSVTIAPLGAGARARFGSSAAVMVVIRPAEDVHLEFGDLDSAERGLIARAPSMLQVVHIIEGLQLSRATVLITGESGVGKEVVARAIHARSPSHNGPFVGVNCAALPGGLLESELFGHVRGAFTGADRDRVGRLELAAKGTLFLDEIGDMPPSLQAKLLRVLQEHQYERLGESTPREFTARVIAATNVDVDEAMESGQLRKDLYYRLRVVPVEIPPLRERREDIEPLALGLLERVGRRTGRSLRLSPEALSAMQAYDWPGNVRELENKLEYATAMTRGQTITLEDVPDLVANANAVSPHAVSAVASTDTEDDDDGAASEKSEHDRILDALEEHHWRRADAAGALGISRTTLWRRMQELGIS